MGAAKFPVDFIFWAFPVDRSLTPPVAQEGFSHNGLSASPIIFVKLTFLMIFQEVLADLQSCDSLLRRLMVRRCGDSQWLENKRCFQLRKNSVEANGAVGERGKLSRATLP